MLDKKRKNKLIEISKIVFNVFNKILLELQAEIFGTIIDVTDLIINGTEEEKLAILETFDIYERNQKANLASDYEQKAAQLRVELNQ